MFIVDAQLSIANGPKQVFVPFGPDKIGDEVINDEGIKKITSPERRRGARTTSIKKFHADGGDGGGPQSFGSIYSQFLTPHGWGGYVCQFFCLEQCLPTLPTNG